MTDYWVSFSGWKVGGAMEGFTYTSLYFVQTSDFIFVFKSNVISSCQSLASSLVGSLSTFIPPISV